MLKRILLLSLLCMLTTLSAYADKELAINHVSCLPAGTDKVHEKADWVEPGGFTGGPCSLVASKDGVRCKFSASQYVHVITTTPIPPGGGGSCVCEKEWAPSTHVLVSNSCGAPKTPTFYLVGTHCDY